MATATQMDRAASRKDMYPSRMGGGLRMLPRMDPVIHGDERDRPSHLDPRDVEHFERDGYFVARRLFTRAEAASLRAALERLRDDERLQGRDETIIEPRSGEVRSVFACHEFDDELAALASDPRIRDIARYLTGGNVYLHQSRINYKPGFRGEPFQWHSDFETWHTEDGMPAMRCVSASIALTDNTPHNGPLLVMPGSHKSYVACPGTTPPDNHKRSLKVQEVGSPPEAALRRLYDDGGLAAVTGAPGTVVFFDCNLMHASNSNLTPVPRSNVFLVYNSVHNRLQAPFGPADQQPRPEHIAHRERTPVL